MKNILVVFLICTSFLKVIAQDYSKKDTPVGTVITSVLDYDNLSVINHDPKVIDPKKSTWIPADGRDISGSQLSQLTGLIKAPDLRGCFIRGLNTIYSVGQPDLKIEKADPDNSRKVGEYEGDGLKTHTHPFSHVLQVSDHEPHNYGGGFKHSPAGNEGYNNYGSVDQNTDGVSETRPKNIAVYYYVKIN